MPVVVATRPSAHHPPVRDIFDRRAALQHLAEIVPVGRRALAVEQAGGADDLGAGADADDRRSLFRLAPEARRAPPDRRHGSWRAR